MAATRVLWVAFDACDPVLARRLADDGAMPHLARFLGDAAVAPTITDPGLFVGSVWASIATAREPTRHGFHCWGVYDSDTYAYRETSPHDIVGTPFWQHLSNAGHRVAILDVPHADAHVPVHGVVVSEWGCHDRHFGLRSYPLDLADELLDEIGPHPVGSLAPPAPDELQFAPCDRAHSTGARRTPAEEAALLADLLSGVDNKRDLSLRVLDRGGWDVVMTVFGESHCAGHQLWHLADPSHPRHDPHTVERVGGDPIRQLYGRLDDALGELLGRTDDSTTVVVQLSDGMSAHHDGTHLLAPLLERLQDLHDGLTPPRLRSRVGRAAHVVPARLRRSVLTAAAPALRRRIDATPGEAPTTADHDRPPGPDRLWWSTPNNTVSGAVRLNVAGREGQGRIAPEAYRPALEWLRDAFLDLVNVDTGRPAVRDVLFADDLYDRRGADTFPDLFVEWDHDAPIERVWSPLTGVVARPYDHWRTGDHRPGGLVAVKVPGSAVPAHVPPVRSIDLAPTVSAAIGVTLPEVDGRPRADLLGPLASAGPVAAPASADPARPWRPTRRGLRTGLTTLARSVEDLRARQRRVEQETGATVAELDDEVTRIGEVSRRLETENRALTDRLDRAERLASLFTTTAWVRNAPRPDGPLVSVVTATYNRADLIVGAIDSVRAQSYGRWEMVIVDDGGDDRTDAVVAAYDDPRLRYLRVEHRGCNPARNAGLRAATGAIVAHLDDDNRFDPDWLKAVVLAFGEHPDRVVLYGARVIDDMDRIWGGEPGGMPGVHFEPWDREVLEDHNFVDMNVLAHRADPALRIEEDANLLGDWDLVLKLSEKAAPLEVPVIAAYYTTTAPGRMTYDLRSAEHDRQYRVVRAGVERRRGDAPTTG
ncbi:MAG: glycosyltransferase [Acidimicrobiales bacterium]|jgi:predicted AlkP superfamily phosphohydrolase/phosphomutase|nr:glycosyltransferase [Acidimicrobiales bacterium]